jgi:hypothetical protein
MFKRQLTVRKSFMIFMGYVLLGGLVSAWSFDRYYYKGPKYIAPEVTEVVNLFANKCIEYKIKDICSYGFNNLVRIDVTDGIWYQIGQKPDTRAIGLTEYSTFSPLTKISIDRKLLTDKVLFDSTVIHELGHAVLNLDHNDEKLAIMNSVITSDHLLDYKYYELVNDMFKDFSDSVK